MNNRIRLSLLLAPACLLTAWANSVVDVVTDSNYRLRGEIVSYGKQGIVIKHPAMRQNAVILPSEIRALYFTGTSSPDLQSQGQDFHGYGTSGHHPVQHHLHHAGQGAVPGHAGQRAFHPPRPGGRLPAGYAPGKGLLAGTPDFRQQLGLFRQPGGRLPHPVRKKTDERPETENPGRQVPVPAGQQRLPHLDSPVQEHRPGSFLLHLPHHHDDGRQQRSRRHCLLLRREREHSLPVQFRQQPEQAHAQHRSRQMHPSPGTEVRHHRAGGSGHPHPYPDGRRGYQADGLPAGRERAGLRAAGGRPARPS